MCGPPPEVEHAQPMGNITPRSPVNSIVRYQCDAGYKQRHLPVIRCMDDGQWTEPQVECTEGDLSFVSNLNLKELGLTVTKRKTNLAD